MERSLSYIKDQLVTDEGRTTIEILQQARYIRQVLSFQQDEKDIDTKLQMAKQYNQLLRDL